MTKTLKTLFSNLSTTTASATQATNETMKKVSSLENYHGGLIALALLILICNLFAIQIYKRHEKIRRNCSNVLLLSLAISDLIVGGIFLPVLVFCESQWDKYSTNKVFIEICKVDFLVGNFFGFSTIFHIIALTIEKYLAVLHPFQRLSVSTHSTYRKILITVWLLALVFAAVPSFWMFAGNPKTASWDYKFQIYGIVQASVFLGLASIILMFCYIRMFFQIHVKLSACTQTGRVQTKARNDRKTVLIFLMFFTIFVVGWSPWFFFTLKDEHAGLVSQEVKDLLVSLRFASAVLNPLIYSFIKSDYKNAVQSDFRRLCSRCPAPIRFHKLVQNSTLSRSSNNNNTTRSTLTTGAATRDIKLKKIESNQDPLEFSAPAVSGVHFSSQTDDTDL